MRAPDCDPSFPAQALANGRLTSRASAADSPGLQLLAAEADALSTSVDALALAWVLSHPWVGMCLSGASTTDQLASNLDALRLAPLPADVCERLASALRQECDSYWADRTNLAWN